MNVDGKRLASGVYESLRTRVRSLSRAPRLTIVTASPNLETKKYLALKERRAAEVGIETNVIVLAESATTENVVTLVANEAARADALIVQLPLPPSIDADRVLAAVPVSRDADGLNPESAVLSPVVGAIREILARHGVLPQGKRVAVVGEGRLVGRPASAWFRSVGAQVRVLTKDTADIEAETRDADIIVSGAGVPGLLTPAMVKAGAVVLDAGTSDEGGELRGDADPGVAEKASLFTPVPGGIGPLTIAILLSNVVDCAEKNQAVV